MSDIDTLVSTVCPNILEEPQTLNELQMFLKGNVNNKTACITFIDNIIYKKTQQRNECVTYMNQINEQTASMLKIVTASYTSIVETPKPNIPVEVQGKMLLQTLEMIDLYDIYKKTNQNINLKPTNLINHKNIQKHNKQIKKIIK